MFGFIQFGDPVGQTLQKVLILVPIFLISITLHEFAHAVTAWKLGDPTPQEAGRVTLNPIAHLDLLGTLMILFGPIGWAKPVPVDPRNLGRWGSLMVAAAGPLANLVLAILALAVIKHYADISALTPIPEELIGPFKVALSLNLGLALFNLLPIPPLDGSQIVYNLLPRRLLPAYHQLMPYGILVLIAIVVFPAGGEILYGAMRVVLNGLNAVVP